MNSPEDRAAILMLAGSMMDLARDPMCPSDKRMRILRLVAVAIKSVEDDIQCELIALNKEINSQRH